MKTLKLDVIKAGATVGVTDMIIIKALIGC